MRRPTLKLLGAFFRNSVPFHKLDTLYNQTKIVRICHKMLYHVVLVTLSCQTLHWERLGYARHRTCEVQYAPSARQPFSWWTRCYRTLAYSLLVVHDSDAGGSVLPANALWILCKIKQQKVQCYSPLRVCFTKKVPQRVYFTKRVL